MATLPNPSVSPQHKRFDGIELRPAKVVNGVDEHWKKQLGQAIDAALSMSNRTPKELWSEMGHNDGAELSRWMSGEASPRFWQLFSVRWFRTHLVIALAGLCEDIERETTLRMRI